MASLPSQVNASEPEEVTRRGGDHSSAENAADDCKDTPANEECVFKGRKDLERKAMYQQLSAASVVSVLMARLREGKNPYTGVPSRRRLDISAISPHPGPLPVPPYDDIREALEWLARAGILDALTARNLYTHYLSEEIPEECDEWIADNSPHYTEIIHLFLLGCGMYDVEEDTFGFLLRQMKILEARKVAGTYEEEKTAATAILEAIDAKARNEDIAAKDILKPLVDSETIRESTAQRLLKLIERKEATQTEMPDRDPPLLMYRKVRAGVPEEEWWDAQYLNWTEEEREKVYLDDLLEETGVDFSTR